MKKALTILLSVAIILSLIFAFGFPYKTGKDIITLEKLQKIIPMQKINGQWRYCPAFAYITHIDTGSIELTAMADPIPLEYGALLVDGSESFELSGTSLIYMKRDSLRILLSGSLHYSIDAAGTTFYLFAYLNGERIPGRDVFNGIKVVGEDENIVPFETSLKIGYADTLQAYVSANEDCTLEAIRMSVGVMEINRWR